MPRARSRSDVRSQRSSSDVARQPNPSKKPTVDVEPAEPLEGLRQARARADRAPACALSVMASPFRIELGVPGGDTRPTRLSAPRSAASAPGCTGPSGDQRLVPRGTPTSPASAAGALGLDRRACGSPGRWPEQAARPRAPAMTAAFSPLILARVPPSAAISTPACLGGASSVRPNTVSVGWSWRMSLSLLRVRNDRPRPKQEDRLEDRGFAGAILAGDQIELGRKLERRGFHAAQILDPQLGEGHRSCGGRTAA